MDVIQIYTPEIEEYVLYKRVPYEEVEIFVSEHDSADKEVFIKNVLQLCITNLQSDIVEALKGLEREKAYKALRKIYNGCIMLNPGLDVDDWLAITGDISFIKSDQISSDAEFPPTPDELKDLEKKQDTKKKDTRFKKSFVTKSKFMGLESFLKDAIIGQDEAVETVVNSLKRSVTGLREDDRPVGVFLMAGASGVGKSELAKKLQEYLFGSDKIVRIDFGEYQQKHDVHKLIGAPPSYVGYEEGGQLSNQIKENPHTVVLLDEVEKAHPDIWNTLLRVFDEGYLTDSGGETVSFKNTIIIMTTNLGNRDIVSNINGSDIGFGEINVGNIPTRAATEKYVNRAVEKYFRPEFINRLDKTVVFNHLDKDALIKIADLELSKLAKKLTKKGLSLHYGEDVLEQMVEKGFNAIEGARGMRRVRRELLEDSIADQLLSKGSPRGSMVFLMWPDEPEVTIKRPEKKATKKKTQANGGK